MMGNSEKLFILIVSINSICAFIYFVSHVIVWPIISKNKAKTDRFRDSIHTFVILFCPIVGIMYFMIAKLFKKMFYKAQVDISYVIFSKERSKIIVRPDVEREMNMAPLEEAIAISDDLSLRNLMLNIIKGKVDQSLAAISLALNSSDSETSHYAASVLRDELNDFRSNTQQIYQKILKDDLHDQIQYSKILIEYMNNVLSQKVFSATEQEAFVNIMNSVLEILYKQKHNEEDAMKPVYYEWICERLLDVKDYQICEEWCNRAVQDYPYELFPYKCQLKLYFKTYKRDRFFEVLNYLKKSNIIIDNETIELIRVFS